MPVKKNLEGEQALEAVMQDGYALKYVRDQTEEICLEAVRKFKMLFALLSQDS